MESAPDEKNPGDASVDNFGKFVQNYIEFREIIQAYCIERPCWRKGRERKREKERG